MRGRAAAALLRVLTLTVLAATAGCGGPVKTRAYALSVAPDANGESPVPVELVVVYDRALLAEVQGLPAREWFRRRVQLERDYPDGFRSMRWELVPGQSLALRPLELSRRGARAAFVFADYLAEGDHRLRIDPFREALIELGDEEAVVRPPPKGR